jgi:glycosyltransferase involved in cell wall biosynthesis
MAVGTPVIAAGTSAIPEVVGDAAVLVSEPARPQAWASAIAGVFGSSERRTELAVAGRERAAAFSWRRSARMMLDIYAAASRT